MNRAMTMMAGAIALGAVLTLSMIGSQATADDTKKGDAAGGHCNFVMKNAFAGPYKACMSPTTSEQCTTLGTSDENSGAVYGEGACPTASAVGTCAMDTGSMTYYEGEASGLEIGCGFQSGTWTAGQ